MKVLIADDDPLALRLLQRYLDKWGHQVVSAQNGAEAWDVFQREDFPLVISDWVMPVMDGLELIRRIRGLQRPGYVYTILVTAKNQKEDLVEGMEAGADDFVTKPFDRDELRVRLREGERIVRLVDLQDSVDRNAQEADREIERAEKQLAELSQKLNGMNGSAAASIHDTIDALHHARAVLSELLARARVSAPPPAPVTT